jgi:Ulp1 family protease
LQEKLGEAWETSSWADEFPSAIPKQDNGCDCGVFALMLCNRLGLQGVTAFDFTQRNMMQLRAGIAYDLLHGRIAATACPGRLVLG